MAGRPSRLEDPDFCDLVAEHLASGLTCEEISRDPLVGASAGSIRTWRRDPRIKARLGKLINERVQEVTRRVDAEIARRLGDADALTTRELIDIRREFLNGQLREETEKVDETTVHAALDAANDPTFMAAFEALNK